MAFDMAGTAYDQFMGRYSDPLATRFLGWLGSRTRGPVLDVGCGTGALTARLVDLLGPEEVTAVDPSESFLDSLRARVSGVHAQRASAESLPFDDDSFATVCAQLVVHFMADPQAGLAEMVRVCTPGGRVAASTWDLAGGRAPISLMWQAARDLDPAVVGEEVRPGVARGDLATLLEGAGLDEVEEAELTVSVEHPTFEEWWAPYTLGVGPAGDYVAGLDDDERDALRERCRDLLPEPPFTVGVVAWVACGRA